MTYMKKFNLIILSLLLLCQLMSCGDDPETVQVGQYNDPKVAALNDAITDAQYLITTEQILSKSSARDKETLIATLKNIRDNANILDENPNHPTALTRLNAAISTYYSILMTERDKERLRPLMDYATQLLAKYIQIQQVELTKVRNSLFSYRFSDGLGEFSNLIEGNNWKVRYVQQERYLANFGSGNPTMAVMLSPIYDLSDVFNLAYSMRHNIGVEDDLGDQATRSEVMNNTFKVMASTSYNRGDQFDIAKFKRLPMGPIPSGLNFDTVDTGIIDLSEYSGKKNVTFAIVFDQQSKIEKYSWISWSIERFDLFGLSSSKLPYVTALFPPIPPSWEYIFGVDGFKSLNQITLAGEPADFELGEHNGTKFIRLDDSKARGEKLLFSAPLDLKDLQQPAIQFEHTINKYPVEAKKKRDLKLMFAEYQKGVHPKDLQWILADFKIEPKGNTWDVYKTNDLPLPDELKGKVIRLGWFHKSIGTSAPVWQMISVNIKDLNHSVVSIPVLEDEFTTVSAPPTKDLIWDYDFGAKGLSEMNQVTLKGNPNDFTTGEHNGSKFVVLSGRNAFGSKLLYSNIIDLKGSKNPTVQLVHTLKFYNEEAQARKDVKMVMAIIKDGQENASPTDLEWQDIDFEKSPTGNDWNVYTSENYILPEATHGKKIRLGWSHTAQEKSEPAWQIISVNIKEKVEEGN